jgi:hypothetical protein
VVAKANKIYLRAKIFHQHHHTEINPHTKDGNGLENHKDPYITETEHSDPDTSYNGCSSHGN